MDPEGWVWETALDEGPLLVNNAVRRALCSVIEIARAAPAESPIAVATKAAHGWWCARDVEPKEMVRERGTTTNNDGSIGERACLAALRASEGALVRRGQSDWTYTCARILADAREAVQHATLVLGAEKVRALVESVRVGDVAPSWKRGESVARLTCMLRGSPYDERTEDRRWGADVDAWASGEEDLDAVLQAYEESGTSRDDLLAVIVDEMRRETAATSLRWPLFEQVYTGALPRETLLLEPSQWSTDELEERGTAQLGEELLGSRWGSQSFHPDGRALQRVLAGKFRIGDAVHGDAAIESGHLARTFRDREVAAWDRRSGLWGFVMRAAPRDSEHGKRLRAGGSLRSWWTDSHESGTRLIFARVVLPRVRFLELCVQALRALTALSPTHEAVLAHAREPMSARDAFALAMSLHGETEDHVAHAIAALVVDAGGWRQPDLVAGALQELAKPPPKATNKSKRRTSENDAYERARNAEARVLEILDQVVVFDEIEAACSAILAR
jgi:hypothetical protein